VNVECGPTRWANARASKLRCGWPAPPCRSRRATPFYPKLDVRALVSPIWTARSIDTDGTTAFAGGPGATFAAITCATDTANNPAQPRGARRNGDASYVGTEVNLGIVWRLASGLTFDLVGAVHFSGDALATSEALNGVLTKRDARNIYAIASRIRFSFQRSPQPCPVCGQPMPNGRTAACSSRCRAALSPRLRAGAAPRGAFAPRG
jgi:hypothetical protein